MHVCWMQLSEQSILVADSLANTFALFEAHRVRVKAALKGDGSGDPFGNAPGVAEARAKKKEREAKVCCCRHDWRSAASFLFISLSIRLTSRVSLSLSRSQAKAEQAELVEGLRKGIRGEAAVEATKALDD